MFASPFGSTFASTPTATTVGPIGNKLPNSKSNEETPPAKEPSPSPFESTENLRSLATASRLIPSTPPTQAPSPYAANAFAQPQPYSPFGMGIPRYIPYPMQLPPELMQAIAQQSQQQNAPTQPLPNQVPFLPIQV